MTKKLLIFSILSLIFVLSCADREFTNDQTLTPINQEDRISEIRRAGKLLNDGDLDSAFDVLTDILAEDPKNVDANMAISGIYLARDQFPKALLSANVAFENAPQDYVSEIDGAINKKTLNLVLSQIYFFTGDFNRSNDQVRQITNKNVNLTADELGKEIERLAKKI